MNGKLYFDMFKQFAVKNAPIILTVSGVAGSVTALGMGITATPKAVKALEKAKSEKKEELKIIDKVKILGPLYWPCATAEVMAIACIIASHKVDARRQAALLAAYQLSENKLKDYQDKVIKTFGESKNVEVKDRIAGEQIKANPPADDRIIFTGNGNSLCYDAVSGRYFYNNIETVKQAMNQINRRMLSEESIQLNDFYEEIGMPSIEIGDVMGWLGFGNSEFDIHFSSQLTQDGKPCLVMNYDVFPLYGMYENV